MKNQYSFVIGVDISKDSFCARIIQIANSLYPIKNIEKFDNSKKGFVNFFKWLNKYNVDLATSLIVMEATGVYWENLAFYCVEKEEIKVSIVNPKQIKHFAHTNLRRSKTDPLDADLIARFGVTMNPSIWNPPDPILEELRQISRERDSFVNMRTEEKNRLHAIESSANQSKVVVDSHKQIIKYIDKQIKKLETAIKEKITKKPDLQKKVDLLKSIPGVGDISAGILLTEAKELSTFTSAKQLAAYAGISPCQHESGSSIHKKVRISKIGNSRIRNILYLNALTCIKHNPKLRTFYLRLRKEGKLAKVALIAVARKLLHLIYAIIKSGRPFDPCYISRKPILVS